MNSNALRPISVIWLLIVSISVLFVSLAVIRTVASAQGTKPTSTPSATATNTPTIIHTDSLDVFVTPHTPTKDPQQIHITSLQDGILVDGKVTVQGKTAVSGFSYYEVEFSYYPNPTQTWFLLKRSDLPVNDGELAEWDTRTLTDSNYSIRLRVYFFDGSWRDALVENIAVRNYTVTQTMIPTSTLRATATRVPEKSPTPTKPPLPTPSPLPPNSAGFSINEVMLSLGRGVLVTIVLFLIFGALVRMRARRI